MEIFSLFKEMRGGEAFIVAKAISPPRAPPLRPRSFVVRCGDVCMYWWGDGCCGIGYKTLCRFIPILHNFLQSITYSPQTTRKLSLSSTPSSAALTAHPTPGKPLSLTLPPRHSILTPRTATSTSRLEKPAGKACAVWRRLCRRGADFQRLRSQPPTKPRRQTAHALPASVQQLRIPDSIPGTGVRSPPPPSSHEKKNLL